jgi:acyl-CoA synthetase (AMP-forming)/AMP-acid ligase II
MDEMQRHGATTMFAVPELYRIIPEHDRLDQHDLSSLRYCGFGGNVLSTEIARRWLDRFGIPSLKLSAPLNFVERSRSRMRQTEFHQKAQREGLPQEPKSSS